LRVSGSVAGLHAYNAATGAQSMLPILLLHPIFPLPGDPNFRMWIEVNIGGGWCCSFSYESVGASLLTTIVLFSFQYIGI
jgi:hypothetical protein